MTRVYNKLFTKILDSSIWLTPTPTRIVWITMLAAMDEDGYVQMATVANVARRANVSEDDAAEAIRVLESPEDTDTECPHQGRRLERVPGGWIVLKAKEYADIVRRVEMKALHRERTRRWRERKADVTTGDATVTPSDATVTERDVSVTQSDIDTDIDTDERESDAPASPSPSPAVAGKLLQGMWNEQAETYGLPRCVSLSTKREAHCHKRLQDHDADYWGTVIDRLCRSSFCRGQNDRGWVATFDWLVANADNAIKVLEGKYDDRAPMVTAKQAAAPQPNYLDDMGCDHTPECPNREWHAMKLQTEG